MIDLRDLVMLLEVAILQLNLEKNLPGKNVLKGKKEVLQLVDVFPARPVVAYRRLIQRRKATARKNIRRKSVKSRSRFGMVLKPALWNIEGPVNKSQFLMGQNTVAKLGGGGTSSEVWRGGSPSYPRNKVLGNNYISKAKPVKIPLLGPNNLNVVGPGDSLVMTKDGKIKLSKK